jgi:hypothetical protein
MREGSTQAVELGTFFFFYFFCFFVFFLVPFSFHAKLNTVRNTAGDQKQQERERERERERVRQTEETERSDSKKSLRQGEEKS